LLRGLTIVFVGINPGLFSAQHGHYFARLTSRFWTAFSARRGLRSAKWMWLLVDHCDDKKRLVFSRLDSVQLNDCGGRIGLRSQVAVS
jgi:hypothetical protein